MGCKIITDALNSYPPVDSDAFLRRHYAKWIRKLAHEFSGIDESAHCVIPIFSFGEGIFARSDIPTRIGDVELVTTQGFVRTSPVFSSHPVKGALGAGRRHD